MSAPIKPNQSSLGLPSSTGKIEEFDVEKLLEQGGEVLRRELEILLRESEKKIKLSPAASRDLVAYIKLLSEIRKSQVETLNDMTDEELTKVAKK